MGITSAGMGSGIDIGALVSQLVAAESKPAYDAIQRREASIQTEFTALGTLKNTLSFLQTQIRSLGSSEVFNSFQATSSDTSTFSAAANTSATASSYVVQVTQLAQSQKSISSNEYDDSSSVLGLGNINFTAGNGATFSASVGGSGTLSDVCRAINTAPNNFGVTASMVNVDSLITPGKTVSKLVLTSNQVGVGAGFTVSNIINDAIEIPLGMTIQQSPKDAIISIDGQTATRGSNSITDVINGLVVNLQNAKPGVNLQLTVSMNTGTITSAISNFVSAYNAFSKSMRELTYVGTDASDKGPLAGDVGVRNLNNNIRIALSQPVSDAPSAYNSLAMIGISIDQSGTMTLDNNQLSKALSQDPNAVALVFSSPNDGIVTHLNRMVEPYLASGKNIISDELTNLNVQLKSQERKREDVQHRSDNMQQMLLKQYMAMDLFVSKYKSIGPMITNAFRAFEKHDN